jgi:hypothetical protein
MIKISVIWFVLCLFGSAAFGFFIASLLAGRKREDLLRQITNLRAALTEKQKEILELRMRLPRRIRGGTVRADIGDYRSGISK